MGENTPLKDCVHFFCKTKVKCVQKSYSFSDTDINYKPSMKNVQSFHVIRFLTKIKFVPYMEQNTLQSDEAISFKHLQLNQSTGSFSLKLKRI